MLPIPHIVVLLLTLKASFGAYVHLEHTDPRVGYSGCQTTTTPSTHQCGTNGTILLSYTGTFITLFGSPFPSNSTARINVEFDFMRIEENQTIPSRSISLYSSKGRSVGSHRVFIRVTAGDIAFTHAIYDDGSNRTFSSASGIRTTTSLATPTSIIPIKSPKAPTIGVALACVFVVVFFVLVVAFLARKRRMSRHMRTSFESSPMLDRTATAPAVTEFQPRPQSPRPPRTRTETQDPPPPYEAVIDK